MKFLNLKKFLSIGILVAVFTGCVQDDDFKVPPLVIEEPDVPTTNQIPVGSVVGDLAQAIADDGEDAKVTYEETGNYMVGYVVSSDKAGNFFEEMVIQDNAENPTAGIRLLIDVNPLFTTYEFGRKVLVKLDGLSVGIENGVATLGVLSGDEVDKIPAFSQDDVIIRSAETATIVPLEIAFEDFSDDLTNLFIKVSDVQFNKGDVLSNNPLTFAGEPTDDFDGERTLFSCATGGTTILSTSTFADFKGLELPANRGSFEGVLTKNFFGDAFNLVLNDAGGLVFDNDMRCDPNVLECEGTSGGANIVFAEDFTGSSITDLVAAGWINENVTGGSLDYVVGSFSGNQYAQITGFNSDEASFEVWLVTPEINMDASTAEELSFDIQANFDNGTILTPFITNNFTGDITTTEWTQLDATIPTGPDGFGDFEAVGPVNISCIDGNVRIAFRYLGGDPGPTTRYHIDNIEISGN